MRTLSVASLFFFTTLSLSFGQAAKPSLGTDSAFKQSLSRLARYPKTAQQAGKVAKVYVDFKIDPTGQITGVNVLNKNTVDVSFTEAVNQLMTQLPTQKPVYAGDYILPVVFELERERGGVYKPAETDQTANDQTLAQSSSTTSVLSALFVTAYTK